MWPHCLPDQIAPHTLIWGKTMSQCRYAQQILKCFNGFKKKGKKKVILRWNIDRFAVGHQWWRICGLGVLLTPKAELWGLCVKQIYLHRQVRQQHCKHERPEKRLLAEVSYFCFAEASAMHFLQCRHVHNPFPALQRTSCVSRPMENFSNTLHVIRSVIKPNYKSFYN